MVEITGGKKERLIRGWINDEHEGQPPGGSVKVLLQDFMTIYPESGVSYSSFNGVLKKVETEAGIETDHSVVDEPQVRPFEFEVVKVEDMEFPNFGLFTTGKKIDELFSDHEKGGGIYGGTVNIVIGESGVGKSTVMLDTLSAIRAQNPDAKVLYVSSEMTRNDILFYYKKTPAIGKVPTLLLMNYVSDGNLVKALEQAFSGEHDIILLDSYQDVIVKLKEVQGWRSTRAESWLTALMIDAAEKKGCAVLAIQHMTKGGTYVGSTYLKHATQAMVEIRFDISGHRYVEFSKNRRGGSGVGKRLYYSLDDNGDVVYDTRRFEDTESMRVIEDRETDRRQDLNAKFEELFIKKPADGHSVEEPAPVENK
jgi:predicted ATP-dependent serine protease